MSTVTAARDKSVICKNFFEGSACTVVNCPYAHLAKGSELKVPKNVCQHYRSMKCKKDDCRFFHGTPEDFLALRRSNKATYKPEDYMRIRDPLEITNETGSSAPTGPVVWAPVVVPVTSGGFQTQAPAPQQPQPMLLPGGAPFACAPPGFQVGPQGGITPLAASTLHSYTSIPGISMAGADRSGSGSTQQSNSGTIYHHQMPFMQTRMIPAQAPPPQALMAGAGGQVFVMQSTPSNTSSPGGSMVSISHPGMMPAGFAPAHFFGPPGMVPPAQGAPPMGFVLGPGPELPPGFVVQNRQ